MDNGRNGISDMCIPGYDPTWWKKLPKREKYVYAGSGIDGRCSQKRGICAGDHGWFRSDFWWTEDVF